jgi:hypothetical protein
VPVGGAGEKLSEIVGVRDAFSQVPRVTQSFQARQRLVVQLWFLERVGA